MGSNSVLRFLLILISSVFVGVYVVGQGNNTLINKFKILQSTIKIFYHPVPYATKKTQCNWLKNLKRQYKVCRSDPGMGEVLLKARNLTISHCEAQFRYNRWNCSRPRKLYKKVYRETALLYAMASSAITYAISRACAEGKLSYCHCGKETDSSVNVLAWKWGLCSDNIRYGKKLTRRFLQINQKGDYLTDMLKHNSEVGINTVMSNAERICKCQGLSGSCEIQICYRRIKPFAKIALALKQKYHSAIESPLGTNRITKEVSKGKKGTLLYITRSPTFCKATRGRRCESQSNCATLCCARGYTMKSVLHIEQCNCTWKDRCCTDVHCEHCSKYEDEFFCK